MNCINSLKIVLTSHPLPILPPQGEDPGIIPSPLEGEGKGEGDHLCLYYYETVNNFQFSTFIRRTNYFKNVMIRLAIMI